MKQRPHRTLFVWCHGKADGQHAPHHPNQNIPSNPDHRQPATNKSLSETRCSPQHAPEAPGGGSWKLGRDRRPGRLQPLHTSHLTPPNNRPGETVHSCFCTREELQDDFQRQVCDHCGRHSQRPLLHYLLSCPTTAALTPVPAPAAAAEPAGSGLLGNREATPREIDYWRCLEQHPLSADSPHLPRPPGPQATQTTHRRHTNTQHYSRRQDNLLTGGLVPSLYNCQSISYVCLCISVQVNQRHIKGLPPSE